MARNIDCIAPSSNERILSAIQDILDASEQGRRTEQRIPYFGPVSVALPDANYIQLSAFARDIAVGGIGLVHLMPLDRGEVVITLPLPNGQTVSLLTEIRWCRDYGNGWYSSGGHFIDTVS
jgi:hypothetical protein